jgi:hypothetical protein
MQVFPRGAEKPRVRHGNIDFPYRLVYSPKGFSASHVTPIGKC